MNSREVWLDLAKGAGIALVVLYHTLEGIKNSFPEVSDLVSSGATFFSMWLMPMFFMVSGLLARRGLQRADWAEFRRRSLNWVYLYVLWSLVIYAVRLAMNSVTNTTMDSREILFILWDPVPTIWFIYALLLSYVLTYLLRTAPGALVVLGALLLNLLNGYFYGWFSGSIFERLAWIYLFYACGYYYGPQIQLWVADRRIGWGCALFFWLALLVVVASTLRLPFYLKPVAAVVMTIGFLSQCLYLSRLVPLQRLVGAAAYIGAISLFVYLTHFPIPAAVRISLLKLGIYSDLLLVVVAVAVALMVGVCAKHVAATTWGRYLFAMPGSGRSQG